MLAQTFKKPHRAVLEQVSGTTVFIRNKRQRARAHCHLWHKGSSRSWVWCLQAESSPSCWSWRVKTWLNIRPLRSVGQFISSNNGSAEIYSWNYNIRALRDLWTFYKNSALVCLRLPMLPRRASDSRWKWRCPLTSPQIRYGIITSENDSVSERLTVSCCK